MRREYRKPTRAELASITSSRPVVRRVESSRRLENPSHPGARTFFERSLTNDSKASEGGRWQKLEP
jgi:hypothetical protein